MNTIEGFFEEYRFLSNFYPADVTDNHGITYPTTEHAFAAAKTLDVEARRGISLLGTPGEAKRAGRKVVLREDWEQVKVSVMESILQQKFAHPQLRDKLLSTGNAILIEGNTWHDQFWGNCTCEEHVDIDGKNALGTILMHIRLGL